MDEIENSASQRGCWKKIHPVITQDELGKAKAIRIFSLKRPYMRSFHASWFGFFVAFTTWFGIQPLLPTIRKELGLSKLDLAYSGIAGVAATIAVRIIIGPLCDRFGPRIIMAGLLIVSSIPMAFVGLITNGPGLIITRLLISILGGTFVPCQFWTTAMFSGKVVGTANAFVGGWGNLGGGFTFIFMPAMFELVKLAGADEFLAWKIAACVPALICIITAITILFTTDDCPQGKWKNRILANTKKAFETDNKLQEENVTTKLMTELSSEKVNGSFTRSQQEKPKNEHPVHGNEKNTANQVKNRKVRSFWTYLTICILFIQYGCCFGVEIATNTVLNLYLLYQFKIEGCIEDINTETSNYTISSVNSENMTMPIDHNVELTNKCSILNQNTASLIASMFGLMNIFARALGGVFSDSLLKCRGLPGRIFTLFICLLAEGLALITFGNMTTIPSAIVAMIFFSLFVQMSEGATYAIVPYIMKKRVGLVAGIVGAGGNAGALLWNAVWTKLVNEDPSSWFIVLGITIICASFLSFLTVVEGKRLWHIHKKYMALKS